MEIAPILNLLKDLDERRLVLVDYPTTRQKDRLEEASRELEDPSVWDDPDHAQQLGRERASLEQVVETLETLDAGISDNRELVEMAVEEDDQDTVDAVQVSAMRDQHLALLEFRRMFSGEQDENNAYLEIQSGAGGTEAQDWANMVLRMYLRWAEDKGFKAVITELSEGEVAGSNRPPYTFKVSMLWLVAHRDGRSPLGPQVALDSKARRHTSFVSVFISPEIDDNVDIEINPADLRIDTYRSSGAGGQHVNTTDSRFNYSPTTNTVAQCQSERSQHQNKDHAMKMLKAKLYELEMQSAVRRRMH